MSQSPTTQSAGSRDQYRKGWEALFKLLHSGGSLSGRERNCCFLNTGQLPFANVSAVAGMDFADDGRALGLVDWDLDGALDVWLVNRTAPRARFLRNTLGQAQHYVALRLEGQTCNRDAIGARVVLSLPDNGGQRIRTVRAGEGYLAQSTKWLHFGLGSETRVANVVVHWPGGSAEEFGALTANQRYHLVQGTGLATPWEPPRIGATVALTAGDVTPAPLGEEARIVLAGRIPVPPRPYVDLQGRPRPAVSAGQPTLINLWASWCGPCVKELSEIVHHYEALTAAGVQVIAISVDEPEQHAAARESLTRLRWPAAAGFATPELLDALEGLQRSLLDRKKQMPVPTSFLIDGEGRLAAIYKGAVEIDQLLDDLGLLSANTEETWARAVPFSGRWHHRPNVVGHSQLAVTRYFLATGDTDLASAYLTGLTDAVDPDTLPENSEGRAAIAGAQLNLAAQLFEQGKTESAVDLLQLVLKYHPGYAKALYNLGVIDQALGRTSAAEGHYRKAIASDPQHAESLFNLGHLRFEQGDAAEAISLYQAAVAARPGFAKAHFNLGHVLLAEGRAAAATAPLARAVELTPDHAEAHYLLANTLLVQQAYSEALPHYRQAIALVPEYVEAHTNLAAALVALGRFSDAVPHLQAVADRKPNDATAQYNLGAALLKVNQTDRAIDCFQRATQLQTDYLPPLLALAQLSLTHPDPQKQDAAKAVRLAQRAAELSGQQPAVLDLLAVAQAAAGERQRAVETARQALRRAETAGNTAMVEQIRGRLESWRASP